MTTQQQQNEWCWTCEEKIGTHKEFRDALGEDEFTCDDCHREEYPEQYGEEEEWTHPKCGECDEEMMLDSSEPYCQSCADREEERKPCEDCGYYELMENDIIYGNVCECYADSEEEEEEELLKYDHSILWITKPNDNEKIIQTKTYYGDDMLEEMFEIIMGGGIQSVGITSISGSPQEEHIIYSWDIVNGANEDFGVRVDRREGGNW